MKKQGSFGRSFFSVLGLLAIGLLTGCSGGGDGGGGGAQAGIVSVSLTDAPACGYDAVWVTVKGVRIHQSNDADPEKDAGWTDITLSSPKKINLLDLNDPTAAPKFAMETLGEASLPAGHYTQLRLLLVETQGHSPNPNNSVVLSSSPGVEIPLETPGLRTGIKLINQFTVNSGQRVDLLLDFDACHSIVQTGGGSNKYKLKPVIKIIPYVLNGIEGFIGASLFPNQINVNHVIVSAQVNGEIVRATVPNATTGKFLLARLAPGTYDVVITSDNHATAVITGVPVQSTTSFTTISTNDTPTSPIRLEPSASQGINGNVTLLSPRDDDATVIVTAKQTLAGVPPTPGPTVTVKSQVATVLSDSIDFGDYKYGDTVPPTAPSTPFTLPIGAPWLGQYSTSLPITLSATVPSQSGVAKMYTIQGTAQTATLLYKNQSPSPASVDITAVPNQNFTLTP